MYFCAGFEKHSCTEMNTKSEILQELMAQNFFASSSTRVASELGISGKMVFSRLAQGTAGERSIDRLWEQILHSYNLTEARLLIMPEIVELSDILAAHYQAEQLPELLQPNGSTLPEAERMHRYDPLAYCYSLALFYTKAQHSAPNADGSSEVLIEILQQVDALLQRHFPDAHTAHAVAADSILMAREMHIGGWCHLMNTVGRVLCFYAHPFYMDEQFAEQFQPQPWQREQWWIADEGDNKYRLWLMVPVEEDVAIYDVLQIPVTLCGAPEMSEAVYQRWGFMGKYGIARVVSPQGAKLAHHGYYNFQINEDQKEMTLQELSDMPSGMPWPLPEKMRQVDNSIWAEWIERYGAEIEERLATEAAKAMGLEDTDYEVRDVTMSRHQCVLTVRLPHEPLQTIVLNMDKHPILKNITVWDDVSLMRGTADGKLYARWENGIMVEINEA